MLKRRVMLSSSPHRRGAIPSEADGYSPEVSAVTFVGRYSQAMRANDKTLTQAELVAELHKLGHGDASETRIANWRKLELLPPFNNGGGGQGRGAGRNPYTWIDRTQVIEQALAIISLLHVYRRLDELYLPLWEMGFAIPPNRIRPALLQPLQKVMAELQADIEVEPDGRTTIEDVIDDQVAEIRPLITSNMPVLDIPDTTLAAALNVAVNPAYKFGDQQYEEGVEDLREWQQSVTERCVTIFGDAVSAFPEIAQNNSELFTNDSFINRYLSLPRLAEAMEVCTDEELEVVQRDLQLGRRVLRICRRMLDLVTPFLPATWRFSSADMVVIFNFGRLMVWVDVALRRHRFGKVLDYVLPAIVQMLERDFDEVASRELVGAGPEIGKTLQRMEAMFTELPASKPSLRGPVHARTI